MCAAAGSGARAHRWSKLKSILSCKILSELLMQTSETDWRLSGQEKYLSGIDLRLSEFHKRAAREDWDHEHCEFCWQKIVTREDLPKYEDDVICEGYTDESLSRWICASCFHDFRDRFGWRLIG